MGKMNATLHGIVDYLTVSQFLGAPILLGLKKQHALFSTSFGLVYALISATTKYPLSAAKVIPFPLHGAIEAGSALTFLGLSILPVKMQTRARFFYLMSGLQILTVVMTTDYGDKSESAEGLTEDPATKHQSDVDEAA